MLLRAADKVAIRFEAKKNATAVSVRGGGRVKNVLLSWNPSPQ